VEIKGIPLAEKTSQISDLFKVFMTDAPEFAHTWGGACAGPGKSKHLGQ
jgi:hypothetical protein